MTRADALALLRTYTSRGGLIQHALGVEAAMRLYADRLGGDQEEWGIIGLVHDLDYERWPSLDDHPWRAADILREHGYPERVVRAVMCHADHTGVSRETDAERALYAVDELVGFIVACALVRPGRTLQDLAPKSVRKKMKDRSFAAGVNREDISRGAEDLGVPLDEHIANVVAALLPCERELGLGEDR